MGWKAGLGRRCEELGEAHISFFTAVSQAGFLALGGNLCSIRGFLRQLLISCWKELGIIMDSKLLLTFWLRVLKVADPWMRGRFIPDGKRKWEEGRGKDKFCVHVQVCVYLG